MLVAPITIRRRLEKECPPKEIDALIFFVKPSNLKLPQDAEYGLIILHTKQLANAFEARLGHLLIIA